MTERYVHAIWCDDIRMELGNKPSFMGVYTGGMMFNTLPTIIPRLSVLIWVNTPIENPLKDLSIKITRDDGLTLATVNAEIQNGTEMLGPPGENMTKISYMSAINLANIELLVNTKYLQVVVETESETFDSEKLHIDLMTLPSTF